MAKIAIVNNKDEVVGAEEKEVAFEKGLIRRIVRVFVFNEKGELFLQRRSEKVATLPNTWDQSVGGHVDEGETYEQAAVREMNEELHIKNVPLKKIAKFYKETPFGKWLLKEFSILYSTLFNGEVQTSDDEISRGGWFKLLEIESMLHKNPDDFTPGFIETFKRYKEISK